MNEIMIVDEIESDNTRSQCTVLTEESESSTFNNSTSLNSDSLFPIESFQPHDVPHSTVNAVTQVKDPKISKKNIIHKQQVITQKEIHFKS